MAMAMNSPASEGAYASRRGSPVASARTFSIIASLNRSSLTASLFNNSRRREADGMGAAFEETDIEFLPQGLDLAAEGGLGQPEYFRRCGDASCFRDLDKGPQLP
jgi:hypothetical protein